MKLCPHRGVQQNTTHSAQGLAFRLKRQHAKHWHSTCRGNTCGQSPMVEYGTVSIL